MKNSTLRPAWPFLLLVLAVAAIYWPGRGGDFAFDDFPNIVDNAAVHVTGWDRNAWMAAVFSSNSGIGHRPLAMATFALNHVFTGLDPVLGAQCGLQDQRRRVTPPEFDTQEMRPAQGGQPFEAAGQGRRR